MNVRVGREALLVAGRCSNFPARAELAIGKDGWSNVSPSAASTIENPTVDGYSNLSPIVTPTVKNRFDAGTNGMMTCCKPRIIRLRPVPDKLHAAKEHMAR